MRYYATIDESANETFDLIGSKTRLFYKMKFCGFKEDRIEVLLGFSI